MLEWIITGIFVVTLLPLQQAMATEQTLTDSDRYYQQGLEQKEQGNYEKALEVWAEAKDKLREPDFRIAQSYIKLVTEENLEDYFTAASEIYFWGLEGELGDSEKEALLRELRYLRPLLENRSYKSLEGEVEDSESDALTGIRDFWELLDPTPLTPYNERLIEHWQRIDYARRNFMKPNSEELDDRADVYLKYGKPYYNKAGQLTYVPSFVTRILNEGIQTPSFASADQLAITSTQRMNLENRIRQYHEYSRFEVWIYRDLNDDNQNTVFLFGTRSGTSSFRKIQSVDDFIPNAAYRSYLQHNYSFSGGVAGGGTGGSSEGDERSRQSVQFNNSSARNTSQVTLTPALVLQLMYYQQFAALDSYFGNAFDQMMDRFINVSNSIGTNFKGLAREFGTLHGTKLIAIQSRAPAEKTALFENLIQMPVQYYDYQFLNEEGEPYSKVFAEIALDEAAYYDMLKETNTLQTQAAGRYSLISGYEIRNESGEQALQSDTKETPVLNFSNIINIFDIPHVENGIEITLSHELHSSDSLNSTKAASSSPFPVSLKSLNNTELELDEPLNREGLQLSDLIVGYSYEESTENSEVSRDSIDFNISHEKEIPQGSDLSFYYELYNLQPKGTDEISEYSFEYSITREKGGLFKRQEDALLSIEINNTVVGETDANVIIIDTSNQETGDYVLNILIKDLNSGATFDRQQSFSIR